MREFPRPSREFPRPSRAQEAVRGMVSLGEKKALRGDTGDRGAGGAGERRSWGAGEAGEDKGDWETRVVKPCISLLITDY